MSHFEFLMVLAGMVVAIAMSEVVGGWGRLIRTRNSITFDWLHLGWTYIALILAMQYWIGMWPYASIDLTYQGQIWLLVIPTLFLVIVAYALSPDIEPDKDLVVREYFLAKRAPIFLGMAGFVIMAYVADIAIMGAGSLSVIELAISLTMVISLIVVSQTSNIIVHSIILLTMGLLVSSLGFQELSDAYARFSS